MSSGAVVATISTTTCEPDFCSMPRSLSSMARASSADSVPVWSMSRAERAGTCCGACASVLPGSSSMVRARAQSMRHSGTRDMVTAYLLPKSTVGGREISASFCTLKLGLGS
ncbi:hypothetical protein BW39_05963 [Delftia sp. RIT313]|nr:hypothetical protein BW39_05963 [Delftia sp. RIT313]